MVVGFLKGIWGKPAKRATGLMSLWGTVTKAPSNLMGVIMSPFKLIKTVIFLIVGYFIYKRISK